MEETEEIHEEEEDGDCQEVMSEVHVGCPPNYRGLVVSRFTFPFPLSTDDQLQREGSSTLSFSMDDDGDLAIARRNNNPSVCNQVHCIGQLYDKDTSSPNLSLDKDGDLVLTRQRSNYQRTSICALNIQHSITSSLPSVGLQVWTAALVLTDFILHKISTSCEFNGITALELGAGTGIAGMALALVAKKVFITDRGAGILDNCATNIRLNSHLLEHPETSIHIRELDWKDQWPPNGQTCDSESQRSGCSWTSSEIEEAEGATVLLAADVIYSDDLTDSFFGITQRLMLRGSKKVLYLALEKRYNFRMDELDVVANGYAHFRSFLHDEEDYSDVLPCFKGEQVDVTQIPQYIREYERGKDVELWRITYCLQS